MPEGEHAAIFETFNPEDGVIQVRVTGTEGQVKAYVQRMRVLDPDFFCVRWADSNTCACAHYGVS